VTFITYIGVIGTTYAICSVFRGKTVLFYRGDDRLYVVVEIADKTPVILEGERKHFHLGRRIVIGAGLGATSIGAFLAQHDGLTKRLPDLAEKASESMAHPGVGYLGAVVTELLSKLAMKKEASKVGMFVGATAANTLIETLQDVYFKFIDKTGSSENVGWFFEQQNWGESFKDYTFALGGLAIYMLSEGRKKKLKDSAKIEADE